MIMKYRFAAGMILTIMLLLTACASSDAPAQVTGPASIPAVTAMPVETPPPLSVTTIKIGMLYPEEEAEAAQGAHAKGAADMLKALGIQESRYYPQYGVSPEGQAVIRAALLKLVEEGCHIIFGTDPAYGAPMAQMAKENPEIVFCTAEGGQDEGAGLSNYHIYYAKIHQGRYLAGIAAGMKTQTNHIGYIATTPGAETISAFTAFYLGAKSVNPEVTMDVLYAGTLPGSNREEQAAQGMIERGADVIAEHRDGGSAVALVAQRNHVWHIAYGSDQRTAAPQASLICTGIDWSQYMIYAVRCIIQNEPLPAAWSGGLESGAVMLLPINQEEAALGSFEAIADTKARLEAGTLHVFAGALKTAGGEPAAITDTNGNILCQFADDQAVYMESDIYSAPFFNALIEGISLVEEGVENP